MLGYHKINILNPRKIFNSSHTCICIYICVYVCMYVCMYVCIHLYEYTCIIIIMSMCNNINISLSPDLPSPGGGLHPPPTRLLLHHMLLR